MKDRLSNCTYVWAATIVLGLGLWAGAAAHAAVRKGLAPAAPGSSGVPGGSAICGNAIIDAGEQCDDGNTTSGDGCSSKCQKEDCGNGVVDFGEQCDDGNTSSGDGCSSTCRFEVCGNGIIDAGEVCDDGNTVDGDGCNSDCQEEKCGNGVVDAGEECDDGNTTDGDGCSANCTTEEEGPACGNGIIEAGEVCDDGNTVDGDGCNSDCQEEKCGNGVLDAGEACDDGNNTNGDGCSSTCELESCGDGTVQDGEQCDPPGSTPNPEFPGNLCREDCTYCGDGLVNDGEACDFNAPGAPESCRTNCTIEETLGCRFTGGGVDTDGNWDHTLEDGSTVRNGAGRVPPGIDRYTFGGQAGAHSALPPQPWGEWTHHQQEGPSGSFTFHGGTASAPLGTEIDAIRCSDPGFCNPARHAPAKQLDFDGVGTFKEIGNGSNAPVWEIPDAHVTDEGHGNQNFGGTFHWFEVNIDDLGEPGRLNTGAPDSETCPSIAFGEKGALPLADCSCPDFYRITIYDGVDAQTLATSGPNKTVVIYEAYGYIDGGNLQIHPLTGFDSH